MADNDTLGHVNHVLGYIGGLISDTLKMAEES
jgi:hypothetical protein